jgi:carboxypeptidase D
MKVSVISTLLLAAGAIAGRSPQHVNKKLPERLRREPARGLPALSLDKRTTASEKKKKHIIPQTHNTTSMCWLIELLREQSVLTKR